MKTDLFQRYYRKLSIQGLIKAIIIGIIFALGALLVSTLTCYIIGYKAMLMCVLISIGTLFVTTPIIYLIRFRPNTKEIAERIDECGLEERIITMIELEGDDSYIAKRQREDAEYHLAQVDEKLLKFSLKAAVIVVLSIITILSATSTTFLGLYEKGKINNGRDEIEDIIGKETHYEVVYDVDGEGFINGDIFQLIEKGADCTEILAEADDGWVFTGWRVNGEDVESDDPYRLDTNIQSDMEIIAIFQEASEGEDGEGEPGEGEGEGEGDSQGQNSPQNAPQNPSDNQNGGGDSNQSNDSPNQGGGAGGQYSPNNQVINGETYYGNEVYNQYKNDAMNNLGSNNNLDGKDKNIAGDYFDTIKN